MINANFGFWTSPSVFFLDAIASRESNLLVGQWCFFKNSIIILLINQRTIVGLLNSSSITSIRPIDLVYLTKNIQLFACLKGSGPKWQIMVALILHQHQLLEFDNQEQIPSTLLSRVWVRLSHSRLYLWSAPDLW